MYVYRIFKAYYVESLLSAQVYLLPAMKRRKESYLLEGETYYHLLQTFIFLYDGPIRI